MTCRRAARGPYWPQDGHAAWGRCLARQAGFAQVTNTGADAFHAERRCRVLLRDIRLLGTATLSLLASPDPGVPEISFPRYEFACYIVSLPVATLKPTQGGPPWIEGRLVGVLGMVVQVRSALRTQSGAVGRAQRLEGQ